MWAVEKLQARVSLCPKTPPLTPLTRLPIPIVLLVGRCPDDSQFLRFRLYIYWAVVPVTASLQETARARAAVHREAPPPAPQLIRPPRQKTPTRSLSPGTASTSMLPLLTKGLQ
ncbi:hypothetical protein NDU88_003074 [Pleurodeles waltl]|uniref:Uncharacterized protein n=1 Tax=Pleurodeles waltl TaxID=8319 RepID=A0AAV7QAS0_PLEWA|nr:hypothetical protein NDU88_003074 [Pleurodeles waltl]